ncbi:hypothetical protein [Pelagicoccus mobilis]|uniref:Tetratricopeptide repeat protein n=1 Tax=Pelagicoccus mobilis TaxID=415221 RepID=A0A934RXS1_9BACT|nr:hypothetical protein [Pelagicoccus mobilis]MBK1879685.1 hypothetical protein [Pelagicoccus mobilis]
MNVYTKFGVVVIIFVVSLTPSVGKGIVGTDESFDGIVDYPELGAIHFPNSGATEAQDAFYRGVLLLHSFEYKQAASAFREAQEIDPNFVLAYWGEAMTYNRPIWSVYMAEEMQAALEKLAPTRKERLLKAKTERERMYLDAIETLLALKGPSEEFVEKEMCSNGQSKEFVLTEIKRKRDRAYMGAMRKLHDAYPEDDEARSFYGLSILGSRNGKRDFTTYMQAAAVVQPVFQRNPRHPGAAHYIIHSFDDPVHASLGLVAANAYSEIAPNAAHAQHMTSHIFVALGMWDRTVSANIRAKELQDAETIREGKKPNVCGHYPSWLHYGYLMLGQKEEAEALMDLAHEYVMGGEATGGEWWYFNRMRYRHLVDFEDWQNGPRWAVPLESIPSEENDNILFSYRVSDAFVGLKLGDRSLANELIEGPRPSKAWKALQVDQLAGLVAVKDGRIEEGVALLRKAAGAEDALPLEFGPPRTVVPTFELLGKTLLELDRIEEAETAYRRAVERNPRRPQAVDGLAMVNQSE